MNNTNKSCYDSLKLENQLCFPLYACSKEIQRMYRPFLDPLNLTYTQYITMMVLWEHEEINVTDLGSYLYLDSATLTPVLKKLESYGYVERQRDQNDQRIVIITLTKRGRELKNKAVKVPESMTRCLPFDAEDAKQLYILLNKLLSNIKKNA